MNMQMPIDSSNMWMVDILEHICLISLLHMVTISAETAMRHSVEAIIFIFHKCTSTTCCIMYMYYTRYLYTCEVNCVRLHLYGSTLISLRNEAKRAGSALQSTFDKKQGEKKNQKRHGHWSESTARQTDNKLEARRSFQLIYCSLLKFIQFHQLCPHPAKTEYRHA